MRVHMRPTVRAPADADHRLARARVFGKPDLIRILVDSYNNDNDDENDDRRSVMVSALACFMPLPEWNAVVPLHRNRAAVAVDVLHLLTASDDDTEAVSPRSYVFHHLLMISA